MKILLWINTILECLIGLLFLFHPDPGELISAMQGLTSEGGRMLIKMYGVAALTLGVFSGLLLFELKHYEQARLAGLGIFALFHSGIAGTQFLYNPDIRPGLLHVILALSFFFFWWKKP